MLMRYDLKVKDLEIGGKENFRRKLVFLFYLTNMLSIAFDGLPIFLYLFFIGMNWKTRRLINRPRFSLQSIEFVSNILFLLCILILVHITFSNFFLKAYICYRNEVSLQYIIFFEKIFAIHNNETNLFNFILYIIFKKNFILNLRHFQTTFINDIHILFKKKKKLIWSNKVINYSNFASDTFNSRIFIYGKSSNFHRFSLSFRVL